MSQSLVLVIDCGTQSTRCFAFNRAGGIVAKAIRERIVYTPAIGVAEQDVGTWWSTACEVIKEVTSSIETAQIAAVTIAYMRESIAVIDKDGNGVHPAIIWYDERGQEAVDLLENSIGGDSFLEITGKMPNYLSPIFKLAWLSMYESETIKKTWKVVDAASYLHWKLTEKLISVISGADTTGILNVFKRDWDNRLIAFAGLKREQLPELVETGTVIGQITREASEKTGIPTGVSVVAGAGDGQAFSVGTAHGNCLVLNMGTAITGGVNISRFVTNKAFRTNISCVRGKYTAEFLILSGCLVITWFVNQMGPEEKENAEKRGISPEDLLERKIRIIPPGSEGLVTVPYLSGNYVPLNNLRLRGATLGWGLHHTRAHMYRSILEGFAYEIRNYTEALEQINGPLPEQIYVGGGGAKCREWMGIIANVLHKEVHVSHNVENTALGCFRIVAKTLEWGNAYEDIAADGDTFVIFPEEDIMKAYDILYLKYSDYKAGGWQLTIPRK